MCDLSELELQTVVSCHVGARNPLILLQPLQFLGLLSRPSLILYMGILLMSSGASGDEPQT